MINRTAEAGLESPYGKTLLTDVKLSGANPGELNETRAEIPGDIWAGEQVHDMSVATSLCKGLDMPRCH